MICRLVCLLLFILVPSAGADAYTLQEVIKRGSLVCGVAPDSPGFSTVNEERQWSGFDVDFCRAVAAAVLGDSGKAEFKPLTENEVYTALLSGEVDLLARSSSWTLTRDTAQAVRFAGISYHDQQGFLVAKSLGSKKSTDLGRVKICGPVNSPYLPRVEDHFKRSAGDYRVVPFDSLDLAVKGFMSGSCELISLPVSQLEGIRSGMSRPDDALLLKDRIGKEPLGPVVRLGDDSWFTIIRWVLFALINAEELGISSVNSEVMRLSNRLEIKTFFGLEGTGGKGLGLENDWAAQVIIQVGNYAELFDRHLGKDSVLKLERAENRLWGDGGILYAPPLR
jgi:general L-amino acid transport system substrate-binding protein